MFSTARDRLKSGKLGEDPLPPRQIGLNVKNNFIYIKKKHP
jgi:hypothetical protein